jgi:hypothetical protein
VLKQIAARLTYANVMATIAVFVALGGASYAATSLAKNSVGSKQIKNGAVTGAKIKNGAVTAAKIGTAAVTGSKIDLATLGTVPSATNASHAAAADSATHATSAETASHATSADSATHATSADSATHAESATSANSATTAANAEQLAGHAASAYLNRAAQAISDFETSVAAETATNLTQGGSLSITVPEGVSKVLAQGEVSFGEPSANDVLSAAWIEEAPGTCPSSDGPGWENRAFGSLSLENKRDEVVETILLSVTPGVHTYILCGYTSGGSTKVYLHGLTLQTVATGPTG